MNIIETCTVGDTAYRVRLERDEDASNPRTEYDNAGHALTVPGMQYIDVDEDGGPLSEAWSRHFKDRDNGMELFIRWARITHNAWTETHTPYDGANSVWYILPAEVEKHGITDPLACLRGEIAEYRAWCVGDVWGYIIERSVDWHRDDDPDAKMTTWEQVDDGSCWGFSGYEYAEVEAKREFTEYLKGLQK